MTPALELGLLDALPDYIIEHGGDGRIRRLNRAARANAVALGLDPERFIGKHPRELSLPAGLVTSLQTVVDRARSDGAFVGEVLVPQAGGPRWREDRGVVLRGADGDIAAIVVISRDIHEHKMAETRLRMLSCAGVRAESADLDGVLAGIAADSVPGFADACFVTTDLADPQLDDALRAPLRAGRSVLVADGESPGPRSLIAVPVPVDGQPAGAVVFTMTARSERRFDAADRTIAAALAGRVGQLVDRARLARSLARTEVRFRVALAHSNIAVFEQDAGGAVRWIHNPHFGRAAEEVDEKRPADFPRLAESPALAELRRRIVASGERLRQEIAVERDDEVRHYLVHLEPADGGVTGAAIDITEAKRAQADLAQAVAFRERVMGILGHDLSNPLGAVSGLTALLRRRPGLSVSTLEVLGEIERAAGRMGELIERLLDFTRARFRGTLPIVRAPADLRELATGVVHELLAARPTRAVEIDAAGHTRGAWDAARVSQVLSNLVGNALTHGAPDRAVRVQIDGHGEGEVLVHVTNQGAPIPPDAVAALFEPFQRGRAADEAHLPGLGLGLYIARQIVLAHGGRIAVASSATEGTTFTVTLPRS